MKAKEQATVAGSITCRGFITERRLAEDRMGSTRFTAAMLEQICVSSVVTKTTRKVSNNGGHEIMASLNTEPAALSRPDWTKPSLSAKPPPMSKSTPQGMLSWAAFQVKRDSPGRTLDGRRNSSIAHRILGVAPLVLSKLTHALLVTHFL